MGYTVPQRIHRGVDSVEIFFRVRSVRRDTAIRVMDGQTQIARFRREHMAPGEMENIKLPRVLLDRIQGDTPTVEIEAPAVGRVPDAPQPSTKGKPVVAADPSGHTPNA